VAGDLGPALDGDLAVLGIEPHHDMAGKRIAGLVQKTGILHRGGADDDIAHAIVEIALDGGEITNAATQLHRHLVADGIDNRANRHVIDRLPGKCTIEVDQMQATGAQLLPVKCSSCRILGKHRGPVHLALFQAHAVAVFKVDRGNNQHGRTKKN